MLFDRKLLEGSHIHKFKYFKVVVITTSWFWNESRHMGQWSRTGDSGIISFSYNLLTFDKNAKLIHLMKKRQNLQQVVLNKLKKGVYRNKSRSFSYSGQTHIHVDQGPHRKCR